jgi:hypothetical protein
MGMRSLDLVESMFFPSFLRLRAAEVRKSCPRYWRRSLRLRTRQQLKIVKHALASGKNYLIRDRPRWFAHCPDGEFLSFGR